MNLRDALHYDTLHYITLHCSTKPACRGSWPAPDSTTRDIGFDASGVDRRSLKNNRNNHYHHAAVSCVPAPDARAMSSSQLSHALCSEAGEAGAICPFPEHECQICKKYDVDPAG